MLDLGKERFILGRDQGSIQGRAIAEQVSGGLIRVFQGDGV